MSWFQKILPPSINARLNGEKKNIPEGVWTKCPACEQTLAITEVENNLYVCPKCDHHMRIKAHTRLAFFLDEDGRQEIGAELTASDPLKFKDTKKYPDRIKAAVEQTGQNEAIVVMAGTLLKTPVVAACFEFEFMGGSMGSVVGERFVRGVQFAIKKQCPFICFAASGGARMQESILSLLQMAKTTAILHDLADLKIPFISVLTDPTMGGVSASFAFVGDVVIAEPKALIGFAGPRVIEQTVREKLPDGFQRAEFLLEKGAIDCIVDRRDLKNEIFKIIQILSRKNVVHTDLPANESITVTPITEVVDSSSDTDLTS